MCVSSNNQQTLQDIFYQSLLQCQAVFAIISKTGRGCYGVLLLSRCAAGQVRLFCSFQVRIFSAGGCVGYLLQEVFETILANVGSHSPNWPIVFRPLTLLSELHKVAFVWFTNFVDFCLPGQYFTSVETRQIDINICHLTTTLPAKTFHNCSKSFFV